jgi:hypothetical protein
VQTSSTYDAPRPLRKWPESMDGYRARLKELAKNPEQLEDQMQMLDDTLSERGGQLKVTEAEYRDRTSRHCL